LGWGKSRARLTPADMNFILEALSGGDRKKRAIKQLMSEKSFIDHLLDRAELFDRIVHEHGLTRISPSLYFYVLARHVMLAEGVDNRRVSDYISSMMVEFLVRERLYRVSLAHDEIFKYIVDLVAYLDGADSRDRFLIRTHIGNYSLFLLGLFPEYIRARNRFRKYCPGETYYEDMGSINYRLAADNRLAERLELSDVLSVLGDRFHVIRTSLNHIAHRYLHLQSG